MKKIYIDFDGVIMDTWPYFVNKFVKEYGNIKITSKLLDPLILSTNWEEVISEDRIINDSINDINKLKEKYDVTIITKINIDNEVENKTKFLYEHNINDIIFVSYHDSKSNIVNPKGNILIDDTIKNLDEWSNKGGIAIFFDKDNNNIDPYNNKNIKYESIDSLIKIEKIIEKLLN